MTSTGMRILACPYKTGVIVLAFIAVSLVLMEMQNMVLHKDPWAMSEVELINEVRKVRLLCVILTMEKNLNTKVKAVNNTWANRCDMHFYVLSSNQTRSDFLNMDIPDDRHHLIYKIEGAFKTIYQRYIDEFDFLLKADDDTYVVVENLKFLLWHYKANAPGYLGYHYDKFVGHGYMSGGAGYVISNRGLRNLVERGYNGERCPILHRTEDPEHSEDVETSRCLEVSGVQVWSSLDIARRETFHPFSLEHHLAGHFPKFIYSYAMNPVLSGKACCAEYVISFHYMKPEAMLYIDHVLYGIKVFGLQQKRHQVFRIGPVST